MRRTLARVVGLIAVPGPILLLGAYNADVGNVARAVSYTGMAIFFLLIALYFDHEDARRRRDGNK